MKQIDEGELGRKPRRWVDGGVLAVDPRAISLCCKGLEGSAMALHCGGMPDWMGEGNNLTSVGVFLQPFFSVSGQAYYICRGEIEG